MGGVLMISLFDDAQIVVTWQFAHNVLGVVGLYTEKDYNHWVTIALGWVRC